MTEAQAAADARDRQVHIGIGTRAIEDAIASLKSSAMKLHAQAARTTDLERAAALRREADAADASAEQFRQALRSSTDAGES